MMHHRVADDRKFQDFVGGNATLRGRVGGKRGKRLAHHRRRFVAIIRVELNIGKPAHHVLAETDLRVHDAGRGNDLAGGEIGKMGGNGRGTEIDRQAKDAVAKAGPEGHQPGVVADRHGDRIAAIPQGPRQLAQKAELGHEFLERPLLRQGGLEAL